MKPQFQIRPHPHGGTFQIYHLNNGNPTRPWREENSVQACMVHIELYMLMNSHRSAFYLEVINE